MSCSWPHFAPPTRQLSLDLGAKLVQEDDDSVRFDYRLRPGRAVHGNALALMRAVGLEVDTAGQTLTKLGR